MLAVPRCRDPLPARARFESPRIVRLRRPDVGQLVGNHKRGIYRDVLPGAGQRISIAAVHLLPVSLRSRIRTHKAGNCRRGRRVAAAEEYAADHPVWTPGWDYVYNDVTRKQPGQINSVCTTR